MKLGATGLYLSVKHKETEYADYIEKFEYSHAEDEDDSCTFTITVDDVSIIDRPEFKTNKEWVVTWGYVGGKELQHKEKIYIEDIGIDINDKGISINITGHDKASVYRRYTSKGTHTNATLPGYLAKKGEEVGVTTYIDLPMPTPWDTPKGKPSDKPFPKRHENFLPSKKFTVAQQLKNDQNTLREVIPGIYRGQGEAYPSTEKLQAIKAIAKERIEAGERPEDVQLKIYYEDKFYKTKTLVEANKTTKQIAKKLAMSDPNGPYTVSGHSDVVIIKKRNVDVKPIYRYEYGQHPNELISFKPSMRKRTVEEKKTKEYSGNHFDPIKKNFTRSIPTKPKYEVRLQSPLKLADGERLDIKTGAVNGTTSGITKDFLNTTRAVRDQIAAPIPITLYTKSPIPTAPEDIVPNSNDTVKVGEAFADPAHAAANASNKQVLTEQEDSPGSAVFLGNPAILSGVAVYIGGVSKKFSSNYYITKATHNIDNKGGYKVTCDILKSTISTGKNLPLSESISDIVKNNKPIPTIIKKN